MKFTPGRIHAFLFLRLPAAFWCGVRVERIDEGSCITRIRHRWINQNPFGSMYFAAQAMAAELSTGALVMQHVSASSRRVSMLVARNEATFTKKARGLVRFTCQDGLAAKDAIARTVASGEGETLWMQSNGVDEQGQAVAQFRFEWTLKRSG